MCKVWKLLEQKLRLTEQIWCVIDILMGITEVAVYNNKSNIWEAHTSAPEKIQAEFDQGEIIRRINVVKYKIQNSAYISVLKLTNYTALHKLYF